MTSVAAGAQARVHDLLRLDGPPASWVDAPAWVRAALRLAPFVVVRRLTPPAGMVCVGVRGPTRAHRHGGVIPDTLALARITPESLANVVPAAGRIEQVPALAVLPRVRALCASFGMPWGPTGSVGFELASGAPVATPFSDLDLILRTGEPLALPAARALAQALDALAHEAAVRIDAQLETPHGAVALIEYAAAPARMLWRTAAGPRMADARALP